MILSVVLSGFFNLTLFIIFKPNREDEYTRIEAAGGKVIQWNGYRVFGVLAMSRSIGMPFFVSSQRPLSDNNVFFVVLLFSLNSCYTCEDFCF